MNLLQHFTNIKDFRVKGRCKYLLSDILILILCGEICDCSDFAEIADFGKDKETFLRQELGLELSQGVPSEDTLWRVMRYLSPQELEKSMQSCYKELHSHLQNSPLEGNPLEGKHLSIDGKEMRGTVPEGKKHALVQQVSVWVSEQKLSIAQVKVAEKSNEITAIPLLLDLIECRESIITIDAIGCQKEIIAKIIEKQAHYLISLKNNQSALYEQVSDWLLRHKTQFPYYTKLDKDHGRAEQRKVYVCKDLRMLEQTQQWAGLRSIILVESTRIEKGRQQNSQRFFISSLDSDEAKTYADLLRGHWGIENGLHWQLDVTFREDASKVRKDKGPENLSIMRKFALSLLANEKSKISMKRKRKKAARDHDFLIQILKNT